MKKLFLACIAAAAFCAAPALAVAKPQKPVPPPPTPPAQSWTGFYVGGNVGWGRADPKETETDIFYGAAPAPTPGVFFPTQTSLQSNSVIAGVHGGYNWQFAPTWVMGVEADWDHAHFNKSGSTLTVSSVGGGIGVPPPTPAFAQATLSDPWSVRGRLGYVVQPTWMVYATGGFAEVDLKLNANLSCVAHCITAPYANPGFVSATRSGWVVGSGVEFKSPGSNWITGLEYLYYSFAGNTNTPGFATGSNICVTPLSTAGTACTNYSVGSFNVQTVRLRLSYMFN